MSGPTNINTKFDRHDFEQLMLLARINKVKRAELIRRIVKAYLDGAKARLKEQAA